jgi:hypothetical protein
MPNRKKDRLRSVLTKKQLVRVRRIMTAKAGREHRLAALKEYYNEPPVAKRLARMGWHPDALAVSTLSISG